MKSMKDKRTKELLILFIFFFLGLVIKIVLWSNTNYLSRDSVFYLQYIEMWNHFGFKYNSTILPNLEFPPLYFFLVQAIMYFDISSTHSGLAINIILGSLIPIVGFFIVKEITKDIKMSLISLIVLLLHPTLNRYSIETQRDVGYIFFSCLAILMLLKTKNCGKSIYAIGTGTFLAFSFLFRFETLELIPLGIILLFLGKKSWLGFIKKSLLVTFFFILFFCLVSALIGLKQEDIKYIYFDLYLNRAMQ